MKRKLAVLLLFAAVVVVAMVFSQRVSLDTVVQREIELRDWINESPAVALTVGFLVYFLASLVPGTGGKAIIYGWLFGFWAAFVIVSVALPAAAVVTFLAIRYAFQDLVRRKFTTWVRRVDSALHREGATYLLTLRLLHAPYTLTNYLAGATSIGVGTFWWTTQVGMLPGNFVFVLAGSQLPTLRQLTHEDPWHLVDLPLLVGVSLAALFPVTVRWAVRRWKLTQDATFADSDDAG